MEKREHHHPTETTKIGFNVREYCAERLLYYYKEAVAHRSCEFKHNQTIESNINTISEFLTKKTGKLGVYMCGRTGNGKTTMAYAIKNVISDLSIKGFFVPNRFGLVTMIRAMDIVVGLLQNSFERFDNACKVKFLIIDDIGQEPLDVTMYGNVFNPIREILFKRYESKLPTIITTNLSAKDFKNKYNDERLNERIKETYINMIFRNESYR